MSALNPTEARNADSFLATQPTAEPARPRMRLLDWRPIRAGALLGRAKVQLPNGLEITDIGVFAKDGRFWAQLPAQMQRDTEGRLITDDRGKPRYVSSIRWSSRDLQDGFSIALIALLAPGALDGA